MTPRWQIQEVDWPGDVTATARLWGAQGELMWLDSAREEGTPQVDMGHSLLAKNPLLTIEQSGGACATLRCGGEVVQEAPSAWELWRSLVQRLPKWPLLSGRLGPGWMGYIGFEMGGRLERWPDPRHDDFGLPWFRLSLFDRVIVLDHQRRRALAIAAPELHSALGLSAITDHPGEDREWIDDWCSAAAVSTGVSRQSAVPLVHYEQTRAEYEQRVQKALDYIAAGDIYQVNLAQRVRLKGLGEPLPAYGAIRAHNPAPYGALLRWDEGAILSASPELFLRVRGDEVLTSPIKGTRSRTRDPLLDEAARCDLWESAKDGAELTMIVDLHRNDLGRVCRYGSVRVMHARRLETHPTVFHTVADVTGQLAPDRDALDLLTSAFPAGSISGVPKIRAVEIIRELEPVVRGAFSGGVGCLGLDKQMSFNVAIRTLQMRGDEGVLHVGGGIVADSKPDEEYDEALAKARGVLEPLGARTANEGVLRT